VEALEHLLSRNDEIDAARALRAALLIQHAEGDEVVPIDHSRALLDAAGSTVKQLVAVPGGHHRSVQHDPELQAQAVAFARAAIADQRRRTTGRA
jgi:alpha-beta hydrolase superfamily lysophospholipase